MKNYGIMVIALAMVILMTGIVLADPGVNQTFETQGVSLVTSIQAKGNMYNAADVTWKQSNVIPLTAIPPAPAAGVYYVSTYAEETMSNGVGFIDFDKNTELETKSRLTGQYNIEATKEVAFEGLNGAEITSTDNIFLDGTGMPQCTREQAICVFGPSTSAVIPAFCNTVEMGSTFTMEVVNARTETNDRFVVPSADTPVAMNHNIRVDYLGTLPSEGKVSAFAEGAVMEGRAIMPETVIGAASSRLFLPYYEKIEWREESMADGLIYLFDKDMAYESGIRRV